MLNPQEETLTAYNDNIDAYLSNTISLPSKFLQYWIGKTLNGLPLGIKILEVGTGGGRDANYIESLGYHIIRSDGAKSFVEYNQQQGKEAMVYNVLTDSLQESYDLIFANAVLVHFTHEQCESILRSRKEHLRVGGRISVCIEQGTGEGIQETKGIKRYYYYRSEKEIQDVMKKLGYKNIDIRSDEPEPGRVWIRCIATL